LTDLKVTVLGVGLIGGSIGLAARRLQDVHVVGYDPDASALSRAMELGALDESALEVAHAVSGADVVFVATPVGVSADAARQALGVAPARCVVSDVGSTKRQIVQAVTDPRFVGGHPLAGAETGGVENAREDLFEGATWYLTPSPDTPPAVLERLRGLIERLGARPVAIESDAHDRLMANVSHLPHVLANVLVARTLRTIESERMTGENGGLGTGPSFRDAIRVAGANTAIWTDIYMSNYDLLADTLDESIEELSAIRDALDARDAETIAAWNDRVLGERKQLQRAGLAPDS
jgi:prephenate dehydrogenase